MRYVCASLCVCISTSLMICLKADTAADSSWTWIDGTALPLEGKAFFDTERYYDRLPNCWAKEYPSLDWQNQRCSAGMAFRFVTDADRMIIRWSLTSGGISMPHMPATGMSGVDVFQFVPISSKKRGGTSGRWRYCVPPFWKSFPRGKNGNEFEIAVLPGLMTMIYLPTFNGISNFSLGLPKGASVKPAPVRTSGIVKPVVFYGTSTTQGGCTCRPSTAWPSIVGREADVPIVNLGFSGSGCMDDIMVEVLARIDAAAYVLDSIGNMSADAVRKRYEKFIRALRDKRPGVPIILTLNLWEAKLEKSNAAVRDVYAKLKRSDARLWKDLTLAGDGDNFSGDGNYTVEGVHLNDLGAWNVGRGFAVAVKAALGLK